MSNSFRSNINRCDNFVDPAKEDVQEFESRTVVIAPTKIVEHTETGNGDVVTLVSYSCNFTHTCANHHCVYARKR